MPPHPKNCSCSECCDLDDESDEIQQQMEQLDDEQQCFDDDNEV